MSRERRDMRNWTYEEVLKVIKINLEVGGKEYIHLDVEHCDFGNINCIVSWAKDLGYNAYHKEQSETVYVGKK